MEDKRFSIITDCDMTTRNNVVYLTVSYLDNYILSGIISILEKNNETLNLQEIKIFKNNERIRFLIPIGQENTPNNYYRYGLGSFLREQGFLDATCGLEHLLSYSLIH